MLQQDINGIVTVWKQNGNGFNTARINFSVEVVWKQHLHYSWSLWEDYESSARTIWNTKGTASERHENSKKTELEQQYLKRTRTAWEQYDNSMWTISKQYENSKKTEREQQHLNSGETIWERCDDHMRTVWKQLETNIKTSQTALRGILGSSNGIQPASKLYNGRNNL